MKEKKGELTAIAIVLLSCCALYFLGLNSFGITDPGEAYYAEAGREMVESGDYITPHLNYQIYFSKPILTFWMMAGSYKIFGVNELAARLPFAFLLLLLSLSTYWLANRIGGRRMGVFASLIMATSPLLVVMSKLSPIDITFSCFLDLAAFAIVATCLLESVAYWPLIYVSLALAVLCKGPAALLLTMLGIAAFVIAERASLQVYWQRIRKAHVFAGVLIFSAITIPWYAAVGYATQGLFLKVFFLYENVARFAGHTNLAHTTWYHYVPVLLYGFFPWVLFIPPSFYWVLAHPIKTESRENSKIKALTFLACWSAAIFLFFSFSRTQLDTYLLPAIAPLALLVANYFEQKLKIAETQISGRPALRWIATLIAVLGVLVIVGVAVACVRVNEADIKYGAIAGGVILATGYIAQFVFYRQQKYNLMFSSFFAATVLATCLVSQMAFRLLDEKGQGALRKMCQQACRADDQVAIFRTFKPSIMFYTGKPVDSFFHSSQLLPISGSGTSNGPRKERLLIVVSDTSLPELKNIPHIGLKPISQSGNWSIYEATQAKLEKVQTLEGIFRTPGAFDRAVSGTADWGPLTVPYAGGDPLWWKRQKTPPQFTESAR